MEDKIEVKQVNEKEIWIGENKILLGEDNILRITNVGEIDEMLAIEITNAINKLAGMVEGRVNRITNLNKAGKASSEARQIFKKLAEDDKCGKVAFFGLHPVARVLASFFIGVTRKNDIRFFKTEADALTWLKEQ